MKKKLFITLALIFCCTFSIFAQKAFTQSSRSYVNVPILKVYEHREAYVVAYVNNNNKIQYVSVPKVWFKQGTPEKKAEVRALQKNLSPYMTICFDDGEFYFIYISPSCFEDFFLFVVRAVSPLRYITTNPSKTRIVEAFIM